MCVFNLEYIANFNLIICYACVNFAFICNFIPTFRLNSKFDFISYISIIGLIVFQNIIFSVELSYNIT
ncbi:hypothetical protein N184_32755 [Sinorhizobium sp. GL28]|nr:hypothetical protein N184_32755 [Sinorhizobium sp. GL28]